MMRLRRIAANHSGSEGSAIDTSALMDSRFEWLFNSGFIHQPILIPSRVIKELSSFAKNDAVKYLKQRSLAESALAILESLKNLEYDNQFDDEDADEQVVLLAIKHRYQVVSLDKAVLDHARSKRVPVLSYDQVFTHLRPDIAIGDVFILRLVYRANKHDAIAVTEYGDLIIVKYGLGQLGSTVSVEIVSSSKHGHMRSYDALIAK